MSQNQYFRAGAGGVIYNEANEILLFARADVPSLWQFPQGGMDHNETTEETLWRELFEETAIKQVDIEQVDLYPEWLLYEYPEANLPQPKDQNCLGQIHKWYFLKLKPGISIDIRKASDQEFNQCRWSNFDDLIKHTDNIKHDVYFKLAEYFSSKIRS